MSLTREEEVKCPTCGQEQAVEVWESLNVDVDSEAKTALFEGRINQFICKGCGQRIGLAIPLMYHDMARRFCVEYRPPEAVKDAGYLDGFALDGHRVVNFGLEMTPEYFLEQRVVFSMEELLRHIVFRELLFERDAQRRAELRQKFGEAPLAERWAEFYRMPFGLLSPDDYTAFPAAHERAVICFLTEWNEASQAVMKLLKSYKVEKFDGLAIAAFDWESLDGEDEHHPARYANVPATPLFLLFHKGEELARFAGIVSTARFGVWLKWLGGQGGAGKPKARTERRERQPRVGLCSVRSAVERIEELLAKEAEVFGVLRITEEERCLLPHEDDREAGAAWSAGLWADFYYRHKMTDAEFAALDGKLVAVEGIVRKEPIEHLGPWRGAINIKKIRVLDSVPVGE